MTDNESRLLAAGDALIQEFTAYYSWRRVGIDTGVELKEAIEAWRALAREVRKEKGDETTG